MATDKNGIKGSPEGLAPAASRAEEAPPPAAPGAYGSLEAAAFGPVPGTRYDLRVLQALRRITRAAEQHSHRLAADYKITAPQLVCLLEVREDGPLTASAIARQAYLSPSTVVGILDRLEEKGLVRRERDTKDRRLVQVTITDRGRELAGNAPSPLQDSLAQTLKDLPELEQATIALSLERVVDLMEAPKRPAGARPPEGASKKR